MSLARIFRYFFPAVIAAVLAACGSMGPRPGDCDRRCLLEVGDDFVNALTFKDSAQIAPRLAGDVKITENGAIVALGAGVLWTSAVGFPTRQTFVDPTTGQFVMFAVARDAQNERSQVVLRLRVEDRRIREVESLVIRKGEHSLFEGGEPPPFAALWSTPVAASSRATRAELAQAAHEYYDTLLRSDPKGLFHPDCDRFENGVQTSNNPNARGGISCSEGGKGYYGFIKGTRGRRVFIMDEELGVVVAFAHLDLPGTVQALNIRGKSVVIPERNRVQRSSVVMAAYKVEHGHIKAILARVREEPYLATTPWDQ